MNKIKTAIKFVLFVNVVAIMLVYSLFLFLKLLVTQSKNKISVLFLNSLFRAASVFDPVLKKLSP